MLSRRDRYCDSMYEECYDYGFWYTDKGIIAKWIILGVIFLFFFTWFVGGYLHAKSRMRKGLPLMGYHRWLLSYNQRKRYGQTPQNHFTFYQPAQPYAQRPPQQRPDGTYAEPPPMYNGTDAPPSYFAPNAAPKPYPNAQPQYGSAPPYGMAPQPMGAYPMNANAQQGPAYPMDAPQGQSYPMAPPQGQGQQPGVAGPSAQMDVESQNQHGELPPRPQQAKLAFTNLMSRFRK